MKKHAAKQYSSVCSGCHWEWASCEIRTCPKNQKPVCRYCCMACGKHTDEKIGIGCELIGEKHENRNS